MAKNQVQTPDGTVRVPPEHIRKLNETGRTVVIKVGTSSLLRRGQLHLSLLGALAETCSDLQAAGMHVIVVTSGAIGVGCQVLSDDSRPTDLAGKQAMAAVGMVRLMRMYDDFFTTIGMPIAQVLLSLDNLQERRQYLNAQSTFKALLSRGVIPIVNENDTVAQPEKDAKFGDNDSLSAHIAALVGADFLFLLTDVDGLYTANPNNNPGAELIPVVENVEDLAVDTSEEGTKWGTGGMATKLTAARMACASGCNTVIMHSNNITSVRDVVVEGASHGTLFLAVPRPLQGHKRWILLQPAQGDIIVTTAAATALEANKSLYPHGVQSVEGDFAAEDGVRLLVVDSDSPDGWRELGRAIANYAAEDIRKVLNSQGEEEDFFDIVGYAGPESVVHRNNVCLWIPYGEEPSMDDHPATNNNNNKEHSSSSTDGASSSENGSGMSANHGPIAIAA